MACQETHPLCGSPCHFDSTESYSSSQKKRITDRLFYNIQSYREIVKAKLFHRHSYVSLPIEKSRKSLPCDEGTQKRQRAWKSKRYVIIALLHDVDLSTSHSCEIVLTCPFFRRILDECDESQEKEVQEQCTCG
jgi:hypothetical protein